MKKCTLAHASSEGIRRKAAAVGFALIAAATGLTACATAGTAITAAAALSAAGHTASSYCALHPAARAEIRRKLGLNVQLFCSTDHVSIP